MSLELNWFGVSLETIAAEYETDAALTEGCGYPDDDPADWWPSKGHYFWAAWRLESELRERDQRWQHLTSPHPRQSTTGRGQ